MRPRRLRRPWNSCAADLTGRWLLVFDDAEEPEVLAPFLPTGSGHILITSRNQASTRHAEPVELDVFTGRKAWRTRPTRARSGRARCGQNVCRRGWSALAIEQATAWLAETGMPAALYAEWLETQTTSALGLNKPLDYAKPVGRDLEPVDRPAQAAISGHGAAPADPGLLLARPDLRDAALQRRHARMPAPPTTRPSARN